MTADRTRRRPAGAIAMLKEFLHDEAVGGVVLLLAVAGALAWANLPAGDGYTTFWHRSVTVGSGDWAVSLDLQHWVNDGLMTLFFFAVGLEIKRELVIGELRDRRAAALPALAAASGAALPVLVFVVLVGGGEARDGWGIAMATDIAFAVGVLALLGRRASGGAKLFLLSVAIVDDILAVLVIALVYSSGIEWSWVAIAVGALGLMVVMRVSGVSSPWAYVPVGVVVWAATLESGAHATIAGVAVGLLTPAHPIRGRSVLEELEHRLHPVSAFVVVPVFALANAGLDFRGGLLGDAVTERLTWAVTAGLVIGKLVGIGVTTHLVRRAGWARLPAGMHPREVWAVAALGGIGFTVSLFVTDLAFSDPALTEPAKVGIFAGSLASALLGTALLLFRPVRREAQRGPAE